MAEIKSERLQVRITPSLKTAAEDADVLQAYDVGSRGELVCKLLEQAVEKVKGDKATSE